MTVSKYVMYDNNIYIYHFLRYDEAQESIKYFIQHGYQPIMSSIVAMEFLSNASLERNQANFLHRQMYLKTVSQIIPVDEEIALKTAEIRRKYQIANEKIEVPDAIIAATAIVKNAILVSNNDKDFDYAKLNLGLRYHNPISSQTKLTTYLDSLKK
jgi:predicted nucleic acid-binding protein